jgi:peptidylprolyl isomerase
MVVQNGDTVRVHYTGTLADGSVFDSSEGGEPLAFTVGAGDVIAGFDRAVTGMEVGETRTVTIPAADAYGEVDPEAVLVVPRDEMPEGGVAVGDAFVIGVEGGEIPVMVAEVTDETVTLDANHALAGEDLTFVLTLDGIAPRG